MTDGSVAGRKKAWCTALALAFAFSLGAACSANQPMTPKGALSVAPGKCSPLCLKTEGSEPQCAKLPTLCVEEIHRGFLHFNWSRITLTQLDSQVACVRLTQSNGSSLGYDDARDRPSRQELELLPVAGEAHFLVADSSGNSDDDVDIALGKALGGYDLRIELFNARCQELCRSSRGSTTIDFRDAEAAPVISHAEENSDACHLIGSRAPATWHPGGAGAGGSAGAGHAGGAGGGGGNAPTASGGEASGGGGTTGSH
ncbi:MAG: hypothetical protein ABUL60_31590 [Myxococcales bacterium]